MRNWLIIFFFSSTLIVNAQMDQVGWVARFGMAAGFTPIWVSPDFSEINSYISTLGLEEFDNGLMTYGGGGYAYIMVLDNVRVGGIGFGGKKSSNGVVEGFNRQVDYSLTSGAFTIEYTLPFIKNIAVSVGAMIGGGTLEIDIYQNEGSFTWDNIWSEYQNPSQNLHHKIKNTYFSISPTINVEIPINRFIAFRVGGGYALSLSDNWEVDNDIELNNVPSGINGDAFFIQTGIFLGFFTF